MSVGVGRRPHLSSNLVAFFKALDGSKGFRAAAFHAGILLQQNVPVETPQQVSLAVWGHSPLQLGAPQPVSHPPSWALYPAPTSHIIQPAPQWGVSKQYQRMVPMIPQVGFGVYDRCETTSEASFWLLVVGHVTAIQRLP